MFDLGSYLWGLLAILSAGSLIWIVSLVKRNVSIVDSLWAPMFVIAGLTYAMTQPETGPRTGLVVWLMGLWAIRLSGYITWRNWGEDEDVRYREMRANNEPHFSFKSLYIVFGLQGLIAWLVSLPLLAAIVSPTAINPLDYLGVAVWVVGMIFEAGADWQLTGFKADPTNRGKVLDTGLWRYTRHPNYFGNACIWGRLFVIGLASGGWWSILSPMLMIFLLLKVSGVALLEKDIEVWRPAYRDYITRTNAFFPGPPK